MSLPAALILAHQVHMLMAVTKQLRLKSVCICVRHYYYPSQAFFNVYFFKNIYLVLLDLSCSKHSPLTAACEIQFPDQRWNPGALHCEHRVLATGPSGKSLNVYFKPNPRTNLVASLLLGLWGHGSISFVIPIVAESACPRASVLTPLGSYFRPYFQDCPALSSFKTIRASQ